MAGGAVGQAEHMIDQRHYVGKASIHALPDIVFVHIDYVVFDYHVFTTA